MNAYDTLIDKDALLVARELEQTLSATSVTIGRALRWLEERLAPGPIMVQPDLNYVYKTGWAFLLAGKSETTTRLLDWVLDRAVQESGDLFLPEVESSQGIYRQSWLLRTASALGHPLGDIERVRDDAPVPGHDGWRRGVDRRGPTPARARRRSIRRDDGRVRRVRDRRRVDRRGTACRGLVAPTGGAEPGHLADGEFYHSLTPNGVLDTEGVIGTSGRGEPTWILGISTAFLVDLYAVLRDGGASHGAASQYLDGALRLFALVCQMPLEVYFSWNRVKAAWSVDACSRS